MAVDPFTFREHRCRDPDRNEALSQATSLRKAGIAYSEAARVMRINGLQLSKNDYYNLMISEGSLNVEDELKLALGSLKNGWFHVRCLEKYIVENNVKKRRVIEHFFFCNNEQIRLARRFVSGFIIETDATFNTNRLNLPLSTLIGITNTAQTFPVAHCYITSEPAL